MSVAFERIEVDDFVPLIPKQASPLSSEYRLSSSPLAVNHHYGVPLDSCYQSGKSLRDNADPENIPLVVKSLSFTYFQASI